MKHNKIFILSVFIFLLLLFGCRKGKHYEFTDEEKAFITYNVGDIIELECDCGQTFSWTVTESSIEVRPAVMSHGFWGTDILVDHADVKGGGFRQMMGTNEDGLWMTFHIDAYFNIESPYYDIEGSFAYKYEDVNQFVLHSTFEANNTLFIEVYEFIAYYGEVTKMYFNKTHGLLRVDYTDPDGIDGFCEIVM